MSMNGGSWLVCTAVGYIPVPGVPLEDYLDFVRRPFTVLELRLDLKGGVLPPGLVLADDDGTVAVVCGAYGRPQSLRRIDIKKIMEVCHDGSVVAGG